MAELEIAASFGAELKDGFKPVNAWVANGIAWLDDIQQFYRERSAIEKEYAAKLSALAKKYFEKKSRKLSSLSVGDTPTVTPGSLESASMTTWTVQLTTLESRANEHDQFANQLLTKLADPVKHLATRSEDIRKAHADYATKLEKERDSCYGELRKMKGRYDSVCQEVENKRKKTESSFDHGKAKARSAFDAQQIEMRNAKNTYIIGINVTNKQKERYYNEYVPELLDSLQDLSETRVAKLNSIWLAAAQIETETLSRSTEYLRHLSSEIPRNNPRLDSMMFVRHNMASWQAPADFGFEPSPVWLDDGSLATDDAAVTFLRNVLVKSKGQMSQLRRDLDGKRREIEKTKIVKKNIREGRDNKQDEVEVVRAIFYLQEAMHEVERQLVTTEVEVVTITNVVGDVSIGARNHNFKSQTFKIPTNCDLCGERIWGLSAKGFDCRDCGYTCHSKCEMKVPADCLGEQTKEEKKKLKEERQKMASTRVPSNSTNGAMTPTATELPGDPGVSRSNTINSMNTLSSGYSVNAQRSISGGPLSPTIAELPAAEEPAPAPAATKLVTGRRRVLAPPPTQYVKDGGDTATASASTSSEQKGKMLYAYQENGDGEISVAEGKEVVILEADDGSGWMKIKAGFKEGLVPASYVEPIASTAGRPASTYSSSSVSLSGSVAGGTAKKKGPAVAPRRGAKKLKYAEALYDYTAQSDAEHSMTEGERFVLINMDAGEGWADVEKGGATKSVPANYIHEV